MKEFLTILICLFLLSCSNGQRPGKYDKKYFEITDFSPKDTLFRVSKNNDEPGENFCYVNQRRDTIIPYGQFERSFTGTIITFGIVMEKSGENTDLIAINQQGQRLYEVYWFDNGPDYVVEGMFRMLRNGKIGYADMTGKIVIEPQFGCAHPFSNGKAKVTYDCELIKDSDHTLMKSDSWFYIDTAGQKIK